jgi:adenine-specific DNA-methyltransferase
MPMSAPHNSKPPVFSPATEVVETLRAAHSRRIDARKKSELGQFFTPMPAARLMASMGKGKAEVVRILDAGAGVGSLFTAVVAHLCRKRRRPKAIRVTAYELDADLSFPLEQAVAVCSEECSCVGIDFSAEVILADFLEVTGDALEAGLFASESVERFDLAILNPPYSKIHTDSKARKTLRRMGVETSNIYTGFLAAAAKYLRLGGELIAITPRSFCNGTYFRAFRKWFLSEMRLRQIHSFHSREEAFREDEVLQETVIFRAVKGEARGRVVVTSSTGPDEPATSRVVDYAQVVRPDDPQVFIRIPTDELSDQIVERMAACQTTLAELGLTASTGRVVDFRARQYLRQDPGEGTVPLIYPAHFERGHIAWPKEGGRKPNAILDAEGTQSLLVPNESYVLVRRFSAKEERRRVVAAVYDHQRFNCRVVGLENP